MELTLEVAFAVLALVAVAVSEGAEAFFSPTLKRLNVSDADVRKGVFIVGMFIVNMILIHVNNVDVVSDLLEQNSTIVTVALSAFAASGIGETFHKFKTRLGGPKTTGEAILDLGSIIVDEEG